MLIDPWYDYLAFPVGPLVLVGQVGGLFLRSLALRLIVLLLGPLLVGAMLAYVSSLSFRADEGANIGEGLLVLWLLASLTLALVAVLVEGIRAFRAARLRGRL